MVFLDVVVVALLTGKLAGGSLGTLADIPIRGASRSEVSSCRCSIRQPLLRHWWYSSMSQRKV